MFCYKAKDKKKSFLCTVKDKKEDPRSKINLKKWKINNL